MPSSAIQYSKVIQYITVVVTLVATIQGTNTKILFSVFWAYKMGKLARND